LLEALLPLRLADLAQADRPPSRQMWPFTPAPQPLERLMRELQPDVVGLSVMTFQRATAFAVGSPGRIGCNATIPLREARPSDDRPDRRACGP